MRSWVFALAAYAYAALCAIATCLIGVDGRFFLISLGCAVNSLLNAQLAVRLRRGR